MERNDPRYQAYVEILKEELIPAMGCTEPIALAYAAAKAREVLGVLLWPGVRCIGLRSRSAGSVLLIGLVGGFAPAAAAAAEAVRSRELPPQEASALLPACICSGPSFVILTVGEQLLGSRTAGICLFAAQVLAGWLTAALL